MKVCIHRSAEKLIGRSGIKVATDHQRIVLEKQGIEVTDKITKDVDIVHINTIFPDSVVAAFRAKLRRKPVIYYGHSTMEDFRNSFIGSNFFAPAFKKWITFCYNLGNVIITPTEYSRKLLKTYRIKRPIYALSNGIDTDYYNASAAGRTHFRKKYGLREDEKVVITVGHFIERKGILDYIEMAKKMPEVTFFWFGYTDFSIVPEKIRIAIRQAPENLKFPGYINKDELKEAYQGCDAFCFMSHEETEGIVVLEALACGAPVILRDIPVYEGWTENGVNVYKAKTNGEIRKLLEGVISKDLPDLTAAGRDLAKSRGFDAVGRRLVEIYGDMRKHENFSNRRRPFFA